MLVSQGIEVEIHRSSDGLGTDLRVASIDHPRALLSIQKYQEENRHRRWQQRIPRGGLLYDWQCVGWLALNAILYGLQSAPGSPLARQGDFNSLAVRSGEWWRAVTATGLHADSRHLVSNLMIGVVFLGLAMASYGAGVALLAVTLCGAAANALGLWLHAGPYHGLGASGVVMASLGMLSLRAFRLEDWKANPNLTALRGFVCAVFLLILFGFNPESDVGVHLLGFVLGALAGVLLSPFADRSQLQARWDLPAKLLFAAGVSGSWWMALR